MSALSLFYLRNFYFLRLIFPFINHPPDPFAASRVQVQESLSSSSFGILKRTQLRTALVSVINSLIDAFVLNTKDLMKATQLNDSCNLLLVEQL